MVLLLVGCLLAGCAERTSLPEPTLGPVATSGDELATALINRSVEQRSVRFTAEQTLQGRSTRVEGGLVRAPEGRFVSLSSPPVELVVLPGAAFSRSQGGGWTRHELGDPVPVVEVPVTEVADVVDPVMVVEALRSGLLMDSGDETVEGARTRRYSLQVDLRQQADRTEDAQQRAVLLSAYDRGFISTVVVWVGPGELPVRVEHVMKTLGGEVFESRTHHYSDWNADIRVTAPV
ncbi:hypothetical protein [Saccharothrix coeruleofusca]|uniref:hypothetical protein n=1 Tax=Saccharothrix coeruleofusca TaxID=33919 RepID=UPI001670E2B2|nr:hypothetical protein [Saccharothrix coeruleofusca]